MAALDITMDKFSILDALNEYKEKAPNLIIDEGTITWQVSHVWLAGGSKDYYGSLEYFYLNTIFNCSRYESGYVGQTPWLERVNFDSWCNGLCIDTVSCDEVEREIQDGLKEAVENDPDEEFNAINFKVNEPVEMAWRVVESNEPRTAIGAHWAYLFQSRSCYFYLERNWES